MNSIQILPSILGLSFASGVNLYAAVLVVGLGTRYGWIGGLPGELHVLANPFVLAIAGVLYFLEFFADKIPFVSVAWDSVHTFIRPLGGAALALASASNMSPFAQVLAMLAGGSIALGTHSTKLGYRLLVHASPEPVSNSIFSLAEDFGVVGLVLLVYKHPFVAVSVVVAMLIAIALIAPLMFRAMAFLARGFTARFTSLFGGHVSSVQPPAWLERELGPQGSGSWRVHRCFARSIPGVPLMKQGYLAACGGTTVFAAKGVLGTKLVPIERLEIRRGLIFDLVTARAGERRATLYFTKDGANGRAT
ncbi:MAG: DUF4126 domain-containing protein [Bryobacteraceae bacterium]